MSACGCSYIIQRAEGGIFSDQCCKVTHLAKRSHLTMANEGNIAAAALFIAIVALLIASAQLLQQLFSTADGHRRCQSSVIGEWSKSVRRKFRW